MPINEVIFKDKDGFHYRHPERSCSRCMKHPCIPGFNNLQGDFAKYGCINYEDVNTFDIWNSKR